jgi:hypothetical protein
LNPSAVDFFGFDLSASGFDLPLKLAPLCFEGRPRCGFDDRFESGENVASGDSCAEGKWWSDEAPRDGGDDEYVFLRSSDDFAEAKRARRECAE